MKPHPAQPDNLPDQEMLELLRRNIFTLWNTRSLLAEKKPNRAAKDQIRRDLAGVIGDLETIRMGLA